MIVGLGTDLCPPGHRVAKQSPDEGGIMRQMVLT